MGVSLWSSVFEPTLNERIAIATLISTISKKDPFCWSEDILWEKFRDYDLIRDGELDTCTYYSVLKNLNFEVKEDLINRMLEVWSIKHNLNALIDCIYVLLYLEVCDRVIFHRLNIIYLLLYEFADFSQPITITDNCLLFNNGVNVTLIRSRIEYGKEDTILVYLPKKILSQKFAFKFTFDESGTSDALNYLEEILDVKKYITYNSLPWVWTKYRLYLGYMDDLITLDFTDLGYEIDNRYNKD